MFIICSAQADKGIIKNRIYTHGILEEEMGYDLINIIEGNIQEGIHKNDGIALLIEKDYPITKTRMVNSYTWKNNSNQLIGLIVNYDDDDANLYALNKFNKKTNIL